jgi:hypothetical protein
MLYDGWHKKFQDMLKLFLYKPEKYHGYFSTFTFTFLSDEDIWRIIVHRQVVIYDHEL